MDTTTKALVLSAQNLDGKAALRLLREYRPLIKDVVSTINAAPTTSEISAAEEGFMNAVMKVDTDRESSLILYATGYIKKAVIETETYEIESDTTISHEEKSPKEIAIEYTEQLNPNEKFILQASTYGHPLKGNLTIPEIADELNISEKTARRHRSKLLKELCSYIEAHQTEKAI